MKKLLFFHVLSLLALLTLGQKFDNSTLTNRALFNHIEAIAKSKSITADAAYRSLTNFNLYPSVNKVGSEYLFTYKDSIFGDVPFKVYIPKPDKPEPKR